MEEKTEPVYDYIIGGAGLAGLTLSWKLLESGLLSSKSLLLIEPDSKTKNDRTWCFWAKNEPWLTELPISNEWNFAKIQGDNFEKSERLPPFKYYKIEGIHYYDFILNKIKKSDHITIVSDKIISEDAKRQEVSTPSKTYHFKEYFFKGYFLNEDLSHMNRSKGRFIWQHFLGWKIKTPDRYFEADKITYMDMRVPEVPNGLSFAYILPESPTEALVEYTLFSAELWEKEAYEAELKQYINNYLQIEGYEIIEEEYNKIPMTNTLALKREGNIIPIGTLAGTVKPSTGYSFVRNIRHVQKIVSNLQLGKDDFSIASNARFRFYDEVLINVLSTGKASGHEVFRALYEKNELTLLFRFLDEETNLWQDLKIMNSVPKTAFIKAVWEELF
ncbi:hypothetical protein JKA74_05090 [Marivirga sp. S37H4]|uniref:Lycopene cyclase n=1 Tax=Marivirga aurantiaca TaxID=2802615 RepID=A0A935C9R4_9BACT|nr:lycopene cyclase family protein [Marivirga aurantiaca]MBK6264403.1 hypothetical protein [Marivirga aurantiaca]